MTSASVNSVPAAERAPWLDLGARTVVSGVLVAGHYWIRTPLTGAMERGFGGALDPATARVLLVLLLLGMLTVLWRRFLLADPRFHAPLLVTTILAAGDAAFNILENHPAPPWLHELTRGAITDYSPAFVAIVVAMLAELAIGRFVWGTWPHLASAYISGISVGILIKSPVLWPFVLCSLISITSKYVLRVGRRHIWNPTNFGVTMMLFLAPTYVASLTQQAGNNGLAVAAVWLLGGMILYRLGRLHIPLAFIVAFVPLAFLRSAVTHHPWETELAPITSPMFQLYIFFMITDPKTTTRTRGRQIAVAMLVAAMETFLRLEKDLHSLYHALFTIGPAANLVEIYFERKKAAEAVGPAVVETNARTTDVPANSEAPAETSKPMNHG